MTIEINRAQSAFIFRQNPYNGRLLDWRLNRHGARWKPYDTYATEDEARQALFGLERPTEGKEEGKQSCYK